MVQANEVRLNIWVNWQGVPVHVSSPVIWRRTINKIKEGRCKGIELSPEVLEKCGFEYLDMAGGYCDSNHIIYRQKYGLFNLCLFCSNDKDCTVEVRYLHQLQNLIFALNGTEINYTR